MNQVCALLWCCRRKKELSHDADARLARLEPITSRLLSSCLHLPSFAVIARSSAKPKEVESTTSMYISICLLRHSVRDILHTGVFVDKSVIYRTHPRPPF
jgi:hypothetical protein